MTLVTQARIANIFGDSPRLISVGSLAFHYHLQDSLKSNHLPRDFSSIEQIEGGVHIIERDD